MTKLNKKGVALIAAVVTAVIFLMLVVTVTIISMATFKKSSQGHDRAMALNLAEAGINDVLYQMNYRFYDVLLANGADYPASGEYLNPAFSLGPPIIGTMWQSALPPLKDPFGIGSGNGYVVQALITGIANTDKLVSTGIYNGKKRVISVNIRGTNTPGVALSDPTNGINGIAEAFNKHAVYANTVIVTGSTVNGNIVYTAGAAPASAGPACTITFIDPVVNPTLFGVPNSTALTNLPVPTYTYTDGSRPGPVDFTTDFPGSIYTPGTGTYTFPAGTIGGNNLEFVTGSDPVPVVNLSNVVSPNIINSSIKTSGILTLTNNKTIGNGVVFQPAGGITVSPGVTITGDLIVAGTTITLNGTVLLPIRVDGNVLCDNSITLGSSSGGTVIVNGLLYTSSLSPTAVTVGNTVTNDVIINGTVVAKGTVILNLCTITWDKTPFIGNVGSVYGNFTGPRRVYLPVPGSWREE